MQMLPTSPTVSRSTSVSEPSPGGRRGVLARSRPRPRPRPAAPRDGTSASAGASGAPARRRSAGAGATPAVHERVDLLLGEALSSAHAMVLSRSSIDAGDLHGDVAAAGSGLGVEGVALADAHDGVGSGRDGEGDDVPGRERQEVADVEPGVAQLDGERDRDPAEVGGDVLLQLGRARLGQVREVALGGELVHRRLEHDVGHAQRDRPGGRADADLEGDQHDHLRRRHDLGELRVHLDAHAAEAQRDDARPRLGEARRGSSRSRSAPGPARSRSARAAWGAGCRGPPPGGR